MKISQKDGILIKNLYLSKRYSARRLLHEFPDQGWKLGLCAARSDSGWMTSEVFYEHIHSGTG